MTPVMIRLTAILLLSTSIYSYPLDKYLENILGAIDESADPCQDFHQFACGKWAEKYCSTDHSKHLTSKLDVDLLSIFRTFLESLKHQTDLSEMEKLVRDNYELCLKLTTDEDKSKLDEDFNSIMDRVKISTIDGESDLLHTIRFGAAIIRELGLAQNYLTVQAQDSNPTANGDLVLYLDYYQLFCDDCEKVIPKYSSERLNDSTSQQVVTGLLRELLQISDEEVPELLVNYTIKVTEEHKEYFKQMDRNEAKENMIKKAKESWQKYHEMDGSEKCVYFVEKHSIGAFLRSYANRTLNRNLTELKSEIDLFINVIFGVFPTLIGTNRWMPLNETVSLINFVDATRYQLNLPDWCLEEKTVLANSRRLVGNAPLLESDRRICQSLKDDPIKKLICLSSDPTKGFELKYNANYQFDQNKIRMILGSLLEPSFVAGGELHSVRFSRLGSVFGHELMHGVHKFIQNKPLQLGSSYRVKRDEVQKCVIQLYKDGLSLRNLIDDVPDTVAEDIPDIDGLRLAYLAYKFQKFVTPQPVKPQINSKFSEDQLFFISYANNWCDCMTHKKVNDEHSLGRLRAEIPVWEMSEFGKVFQCKPDSIYSTRKKCNTYTELNLAGVEIAG